MAAGDSFDFFLNGYTDVNAFVLRDISPTIDLASAAFAFSVLLEFTSAPLGLRIEALVSSGGGSTSTPEPAILAFFGLGVIGLIVLRRRQA